MKDTELNAHLQDCFAFLCITDTDFLHIARGVIDPKYFSSKITEDIVRICYSFYDAVKSAPGDHFNDELVRFLCDAPEDKREQYLLYTKKLSEMGPPNKEYVTSRVNKFVQAKEFESALLQSAMLSEKGELEKAREIMQRALRAGIIKEEVGLKYLDSAWPTYYGEEGGPREIVIPTGFSVVDSVIKGLYRKQLVCVFAGYKVGKTWAGCHFGREGLLHGRKVLHISHESSLEEIEARYDMMLGSLVGFDTSKVIEFEEIDEDGKVIDTVEMERDTIYNIDRIRDVRRKTKRFGGELIIKKYPMGTCTIGEIERYLDYLETFEGFVPDILIDDYVEKSKLPLPGSEQRNRINQAYMDRKRIADERNILVITASQITREALEKKNVRQSEAAAEDIRKLGNIDVGFVFSQTRRQSEQNRMQIYVLVSRSQRMRFGCVVNFNYEVGQMALNCWPLRSSNEEEERERG